MAESTPRRLPFEDLMLEQSAPPSSLQAESAMMLLYIPNGVRGLRTLDVGAGGSDLTEEFLEQGADAYALDPRYNKVPELEAWIRMHNLKKSNPEDTVDRETALERFGKSIRRVPERYVHGFASSLPFPNNSFDLVVSINSTLGYLDLDPMTLIMAANEAYRVARPHGTIQWSPLGHPFSEELRTQTLENQNLMLSYFQSLGARSLETMETPWKTETLIVTKGTAKASSKVVRL